MQTIKVSKIEVVHGWSYDNKWGLPESHSEPCLLFEVDGSPFVIMNEYEGEYSPDLVEYYIKEPKQYFTIKSEDADQEIHKIFINQKFNYLCSRLTTM